VSDGGCAPADTEAKAISAARKLQIIVEEFDIEEFDIEEFDINV